MIDITTCPECEGPAHVQWRDVLESTDGPIEHAKVMCIERHGFLLPVATLSDYAAARAHSRPAVRIT